MMYYWLLDGTCSDGPDVTKKRVQLGEQVLKDLVSHVVMTNLAVA
jgi:hypothetical protein